MATSAQIDKAWRHLSDDPNGIRIRRDGHRAVSVSVKRGQRDRSSLDVELTGLGLAGAHEALAEMGWKPRPAIGGWSTFALEPRAASALTPETLVDLVARTLAVPTGRETTVRDLRIQLLDLTSDAGWAQAGCLFAAPGMVVGAIVGGALYAAQGGLPLGEIVLAFLVIAGASIAYLGGGLAAAGAIRIVGSLGPLRRYGELLSFAAWFAGSLITPLLAGALLWQLLGG